jgi:stage IV sporulation protein FB
LSPFAAVSWRHFFCGARGKIPVEHLPFLPYQWRRMIQFSLFNIPIRIQPWFWLTMAFIGGVLRVDGKEAFFLLLLFLIAGFISILVHELGHALTAKAFGKHVEIVLQAFGGYAAYSGGAPLSRTRTFLVTAAGPALQIVLGLAVYFFAKSFPGMSFEATYFVGKLYEISFIWALLNLLPVLPLDGGRLIQTILGPSRIKLTLLISIVVAAGVGVLYFMKTGDPLLPIFMGMFAYESFKALKELR